MRDELQMFEAFLEDSYDSLMKQGKEGKHPYSGQWKKARCLFGSSVPKEERLCAIKAFVVVLRV